MSKIYAHELRAMKDQRYEKDRKERAVRQAEHCRIRVIQLASTGASTGRFHCPHDIINDVEISIRMRFPDSKISVSDSAIIIDWA